MNVPLGRIVPRLETLFAYFQAADDLPTDYDYVPGSAVPRPYHGLLVHEHHMTVTVEKFHQSPVDVQILARSHQGDSYARKIVLTLQSTGRIVMFGIVHMDLSVCSAPVRDGIVAGNTPLGRVLSQHDVLRRIETMAFLRITPTPAQLPWFGLTKPVPSVYGRLALIHCNGRPAVELLEVVAP
jgi:chorismate-pyruvate lyase